MSAIVSPAAADPALPTALRLVLLALLILGAGVWIGGMAAVTVLSVVSGRTLQPEVRVRLFRDFGRRYLVVAGTALVVTVVCGAVLLVARGWDALATAIAVLVAALAAALAFGVRQARAMGRLRQAAAARPGAHDPADHDPGGHDPDDHDPDGPRRDPVTAGARRAHALRSLIALLTVAIFVLAICTAA